MASPARLALFSDKLHFCCAFSSSSSSSALVSPSVLLVSKKKKVVMFPTCLVWLGVMSPVFLFRHIAWSQSIVLVLQKAPLSPLASLLNTHVD